MPRTNDLVGLMFVVFLVALALAALTGPTIQKIAEKLGAQQFTLKEDDSASDHTYVNHPVTGKDALQTIETAAEYIVVIVRPSKICMLAYNDEKKCYAVKVCKQIGGTGINALWERITCYFRSEWKTPDDVKTYAAEKNYTVAEHIANFDEWMSTWLKSMGVGQ